MFALSQYQMMSDLDATRLTDAETALAWSHSYTLLSRLFLEGLTADLRPYVQAIPELAVTLPHPFQPDEAAAVHHNLFRFNIFPHEGMFLDEDGLLGGPVAEGVLGVYQAGGFAPAAAATSPDHIGQELAFLAFLTGAEANAHKALLAAEVKRYHQLQQRFLSAHLLRWLLPFTMAVERQEQPFYTAVSQLMQEIVLAHARELKAAADPRLTSFSLPPAPALLADSKTGLKEIAAWLVSPPHSGIVLARDDIAHIARTHNLPRGFGKRERMLHNLLRAAAQYDALPALLEKLLKRVNWWVGAYGRWAGMTNEPVSLPARVWQNRARHTAAVLSQLQQRARALAETGETPL